MREGAGDDSDQILRVVLSDSPVREVLPLAPERRLLLFLGPVLILGLAIRQNTLCVSGKSDPFLELLEFCPPLFCCNRCLSTFAQETFRCSNDIFFAIIGLLDSSTSFLF